MANRPVVGKGNPIHAQRLHEGSGVAHTHRDARGGESFEEWRGNSRTQESPAAANERKLRADPDSDAGDRRPPVGKPKATGDDVRSPGGSVHATGDRARGLQRRVSGSLLGWVQWLVSATGAIRAGKYAPVSKDLAERVHAIYVIDAPTAKTIADPAAETLVQYVPELVLEKMLTVSAPGQLIGAVVMLTKQLAEGEKKIVDGFNEAFMARRTAAEAAAQHAHGDVTPTLIMAGATPVDADRAD